MLGLRPCRLRRASPTRSVPLRLAAFRRAALRVRRPHRNVKTPLGINRAGFLVLATSYSRAACRRTTIGAAAFHFRVRNGNGWCHCATVTRIPSRIFSARNSGEFKISHCRLQICLSAKSTTNFQRTFRPQIFNCWFSDIYIQEFISAEDSRRYNFRLRFSLGSFALLCWPSLAYASEGLTEK